MAQKEETKEVVKVEAMLPALPDPIELREVLAQNLEGIAPSFEIIKMPTGGGTAWQVPSETEEPDMVKEVIGVIIDHYPTRRYYEKSFSEGGGGNVPDCRSIDGITGVGNPGGRCLECPHNVWGTATDEKGNPTRGKACKEYHRVFVLTKDTGWRPWLFPLPPTSGSAVYEGSFSSYMLRLSEKPSKQDGKIKKCDEVLTKIKLVRDDKPILHSKALFYKVGDLPLGEVVKIKALTTILKPLMRAKPIEASEETKDNGHSGKDPWEKEPGGDDVPF